MAADDDVPPALRLVNFVSEDQLQEARKTRGARVEDGTAQRDRSLYEILQENKDKKDAEFNERFKHRPPKALDEDETEFLEKIEMSRKELERQLADEEEKQLRSFQAAVEAQSNIVHEIKEKPTIPKIQDKKPAAGKRDPPSRPIGMIVKVKPQAKKARLDHPEDTPSTVEPSTDNTERPGESVEVHSIDTKLSVTQNGNNDVSTPIAIGGLVSYSDESDHE